MRFVHSDDPCGSTSKKPGCETEDPKEASRHGSQEGRSDTLTLKAQHAELQEEQAAGCSQLVQKASLHHTGSPVRVQRSKGTATCSHAAASDYELSLDLKNKQVQRLPPQAMGERDGVGEATLTPQGGHFSVTILA